MTASNESTHTISAAAERVELLDWLRALAISLVVFKHAAPAMAPGGSVGVSVFFVLSGYLIASILLKEGMLASGNIGRFILRRIGRIYPMYVFQIAALVAGLWLIKSRHLDDVLAAVPALLTFSQPLGNLPGVGFAVLWTLAAEFWFYVSFPILLWVSRGTRHLYAVLGVAAAASVGAKVAGIEVPILAYYDHFLIGALTYAFASSGSVPSFFQTRRAAFVGLAIILAMAVVPYPGRWNFAWYAQSLAAAIGTGIILLAAANSRIFPHSMPAVAFVGRISYSIYLVHALVLDVPLRLATNVPIYLAVVLGISTFTYYFIEQPMIRAVHKRVRFKRAEPAPSPVSRAIGTE